jgi:hypothetical protein
MIKKGDAESTPVTAPIGRTSWKRTLRNVTLTEDRPCPLGGMCVHVINETGVERTAAAYDADMTTSKVRLAAIRRTVREVGGTLSPDAHRRLATSRIQSAIDGLPVHPVILTTRWSGDVAEVGFLARRS